MYIISWSRDHQEKATKGGRYKTVRTENKLVTEAQYNALVSDEEIRFWKAISARVITERDGISGLGHGITKMVMTRPDLMARTIERFEAVWLNDIHAKAGNRERNILSNLEKVKLVQDDDSHYVIKMTGEVDGEFHQCLWDNKQKRFVG